MELREAIVGRRSIRAFRDEPLPSGAVEAMKESMIWAPSAGNIQARRFYLVTDPALREDLGRCSYQAKLFAAPLVVVGCADHRIEKTYKRRGVELYALQDVAASIQNLLLTVHSLGLGAVWVGAFREEQVRELLSLPPDLRPVAMVPVGVPDESPTPPARVPESQTFVHID